MSGAERIEPIQKSSDQPAKSGDHLDLAQDAFESEMTGASLSALGEVYNLVQTNQEGSEKATISTKDSALKMKIDSDGKMTFDINDNGTEFDDFALTKLGKATWQDSRNKDLSILQTRGGADYISQVLNEYGYKDIYEISGMKLADRLSSHPDFKAVNPDAKSLKPGDIVVGMVHDRKELGFTHTQVGIIGPDGKLMTNSAREINGLKGRIINRDLNQFLGNPRFKGGVVAFRPPAEIKDREE